jgi:hypothetical protein
MHISPVRHSANEECSHLAHDHDIHNQLKRVGNHLHTVTKYTIFSDPTQMARFSTSPLLLFLITSVSAKTTISFYPKASCTSDSASSGNSFEDQRLTPALGLCYKPPEGTFAMKVEEIDDGCSSMLALLSCFSYIFVWTCIRSLYGHAEIHTLSFFLSFLPSSLIYIAQQANSIFTSSYFHTSSDKNLAVTSYLDSTCSMPTSNALTPQNSPCYFLGPSDVIGSLKATCPDASRTSTASNNNSSADDAIPLTDDETTTPGLQRSPPSANGVCSHNSRDNGWWWVEVGTKALMAMGAAEVIAWA